jgi:ribosome recycling factor
MNKVIETLESRYTTIRAGRANPNILNGIMVEYYGTPTPIQSLATVSVPEARVLSIKPFDKSSLKNMEKAIYEANLGIAPTNNGEVIMLTVPELTGETRREYVKQAMKMAEEAKIALRNVRQDENNKIKKDESLREDERDMCLDIVQEMIDKFNKIVDEKFKEKEKELTSI